jgi:hypothetical protein
MKNPGKLLLLCLVVFASSCFKPIPRIYNEGTVYKMPRELKTSDFYKDIETLYQYDGTVQDYFVKIKSFMWVNKDNPNYKIESVLYFVKSFPGSDPEYYRYVLQLRRYITVENEEADDAIIEKLIADKSMFDYGFCRVFSGWDSEFKGYATARLWPTSDGNFENYIIDIETKGLLSYIIYGRATKFEMRFSEDNTQFVELNNNTVLLSNEEFRTLKRALQRLSLQEKKTVKDYVEYVMNQDLR